MKRQFALAAGAALVSSLALGDVRATGSEDKDKTVDKRVVIHHAGSGRLGISIEDPAGEARGALVRSVEEDSPASKAGLKEADVIVRFDGESVRSASQLRRLVAETPAGRAVAIEVTRGGATQKLTATLAERDSSQSFRFNGRDFSFDMPEWDVPVPPEPPEAPEALITPNAPLPPRAPKAPKAVRPFAWSWNDDGGLMIRKLGPGQRKLGIEYMEMGEQLAGYFKLSGKTGVLVTAVDADGPAAKAGIKAGDVVVKLGSDAVADSDALRQAVSRAEGGSEVTVTVQREGRPVELKVTLAKPEPAYKRREARGVTL
jgi:predicted metalloprotease with PDZ domain